MGTHTSLTYRSTAAYESLMSSSLVDWGSEKERRSRRDRRLFRTFAHRLSRGELVLAGSNVARQRAAPVSR